MPELPEVEVLARHLAPALTGKTIHDVEVRRARVLGATPEREFRFALAGAKFLRLQRRGKFLVFALRFARRREEFFLYGHLGMTGRMYLQPAARPFAKHAAVILHLGRQNFIYEDTRYFGRLTLSDSGVNQLGPEPFAAEFSLPYLRDALRRSTQPIKVKLLDQSLVAGVGNIYASEALFRAGIFPALPARKLAPPDVKRLRQALLDVLAEAIRLGSTMPLDWAGTKSRDGLFYYGRSGGGTDHYAERLLVYDRAGEPCACCGTLIRRIVQAARSTFFCPRCQPACRKNHPVSAGFASVR